MKQAQPQSREPKASQVHSGEERRERLLKSREWTLKTKHQASLDFDKAVMTLAGGSIGVTLAFLDKVAKPPMNWPGLLWFSWIALTVSLLAILASHLTSIKAHERVIDTTDAVLRGDSESENTIKSGCWGTATMSLNWASAILLTVGLVMFIIFAMMNQP